MTITILAVGKLKEKFWTEACAEYEKRLKPYARVTVREIPDLDPAKAGCVEAALLKEGESLLSSIPERSHVILLAIDGKELSSEDFSANLTELGLHGISHVTFLIGGSSGVSKAVRKRADQLISFGPITLPHNLARVVLLEQLYRAFKISRGEPYHK